MNGNVAAKSDWLPPCGPHSATGGVYMERRRPLDRSHIHLRRRADLHAFFFFVFRFCLGTEAERGPAGYAATVGLHPRVWRLGLHWRVRERRRHARDGEKETKRRKFFNEVCKQFPFALRSRGGLLLEKLRLQFIVGAQASVFPASSMEQVWLFFLMMHREG